jgi:hypothetical protein
MASRRCRATGGEAEPHSSSEVRVRNVVSPSLSRKGKRAGRRAHGEAGRGRGTKRTPPCRGVERG